jgi:hypothetical protein
MGRVIDIAASIICIAGGIYLLTVESVAGNTIIEAIGHGIGIYFIGMGLFVALDPPASRECGLPRQADTARGASTRAGDAGRHTWPNHLTGVWGRSSRVVHSTTT